MKTALLTIYLLFGILFTTKSQSNLEDVPKICRIIPDSIFNDTLFYTWKPNCDYIELDILQDGLWKIRYLQGIRILTIKDKRLHGTFEQYSGTQLTHRYNFNSGVLDGPCIRYSGTHPNAIVQIGSYHQGEPSGIFILFYLSGEVQSIRNYPIRSKKVSTCFNKQGQIISYIVALRTLEDELNCNISHKTSLALQTMEILTNSVILSRISYKN